MAVPAASPLDGVSTLAITAPPAAVHLFDAATGSSLRT
jgi:hypothetical protein